MATVNGMTAEAMAAIRNGHIISADFDSANNLILTKYDGTTIDGGQLGAASTVLAGPVELATNAETVAGTDAVRAVTPAGLASLPGYRVQIVTGLAESAAPASWPYGVSLQSVSSGSGWTPNSGSGTVVTYSINSNRTVQEFHASSGGTSSAQVWVRSYNATDGGGGWTAWRELQVTSVLTAGSYTQTTAMSSYPPGRSRLYYTTLNSTSWDFSGLAGEVETHYQPSNGFARQTFTQHVSGSTNKPAVWVRTADSTTGWSAWQIISEPGAWSSWVPTWTTSSGSNLPSLGNATVDCRATKDGRKVDVKFEITFGIGTNFGTAPTTGDNWVFGLPPAWPAARTSDSLGFLELHGTGNSTICIGRARVNSSSNSSFLIGICAGYVGGTAPTNTGDVDSVSPFTWASTNTVKGHFSYETSAV